MAIEAFLDLKLKTSNDLILKAKTVVIVGNSWAFQSNGGLKSVFDKCLVAVSMDTQRATLANQTSSLFTFVYPACTYK